MSEKPSFLAEPKRRNGLQAVGYVVAALPVTQSA